MNKLIAISGAALALCLIGCTSRRSCQPHLGFGGGFRRQSMQPLGRLPWSHNFVVPSAFPSDFLVTAGRPF